MSLYIIFPIYIIFLLKWILLYKSSVNYRTLNLENLHETV
jgi:hypothetical protein